MLVSSYTESTETFVRQHVAELSDFNAFVVHGGLTPSRIYGEPDPSKAKLVALKLWFRVLRRFRVEDEWRTFLLGRVFSARKVDLAFAEFGPVGVGALDACENAGVPLIVNFHGYDAFVESTVDAYINQYVRLFHYATTVIAVSHSMERRLIALGCPKEKIALVPCWPPEPLLQRLVPSSGNQKVLFVGRLVEKKGLWLTLLAFRSVVAVLPETTLQIVGDGELGGVCRSLAQALKIPNVEFLGALDHEKVVGLHREASVYTQHSIVASSGDREGTPVAVMEAMMLGSPVVASRHEGIGELIEDGVSGFLFEELDIESQASLIIDLLQHQKKRDEISECAKERITALRGQSLGLAALCSSALSERTVG